MHRVTNLSLKKIGKVHEISNSGSRRPKRGERDFLWERYASYDTLNPGLTTKNHSHMSGNKLILGVWVTRIIWLNNSSAGKHFTTALNLTPALRKEKTCNSLKSTKKSEKMERSVHTEQWHIISNDF